MRLPNQAERAYIYNIVLAAAPLLVSYGLITETEVAAWIGIATAVLGLGLARANTTTKTPVE